MSWEVVYNVVVDIVIPMLAALVGGGITMWGVVYTIKHEQKDTHEQTRKTAKPWIFSLDKFEHYDYKNAGQIKLEGISPLGEDSKLPFILRNTDNGIGIIEKFITANNEYLPVIGRILEKNSVNYVVVYLNQNENLKDMRFIIRDVYGNRYQYRAFQSGKSGKGNHIEEIGLIETR